MFGATVVSVNVVTFAATVNVTTPAVNPGLVARVIRNPVSCTPGVSRHVTVTVGRLTLSADAVAFTWFGGVLSTDGVVTLSGPAAVAESPAALNANTR